LTLTPASGAARSVDFTLADQLGEGAVRMDNGRPTSVAIAVQGTAGSYVLTRVQLLGKPVAARKSPVTKVSTTAAKRKTKAA
jgi:hypothetical protein